LVDWEERLRAEEAELTQTLTEITAKSTHLNKAVQSLKAEAQKAIDDKKAAKKAEIEAKKKKPKKKAAKKAVKKAVKNWDQHLLYRYSYLLESPDL
jgi:hypothetical protein